MIVFSSFLTFAIAILSLWSLLWTSTCAQECSPLCPDGTSPVPNPSNPLISFDDAEYTCGMAEDDLWVVQDLISLAYDSQYICPYLHLLAVAHCGCPDTLPPVPEPTSCPICEDMNTPPNPFLDLGEGSTCRSIAWNFLLQGANASWHNPLSPYPTNQTRDCLAMQATAGVYCGCNNAVATLDVCRICGNQLLPEPSRTVQYGNVSQSCIEWEFSSNRETDYPCSNFQNELSPFCCSDGPAPTGQSPTSSAPTSASPTSSAPTSPSPTSPKIDPTTMPPSGTDTLPPSNASTLSWSAVALISATNLIALMFDPFA